MLPAKNRWSLRHTPDFFKQAHRLKTELGLFYYVSQPEGFQATVIAPKHTFRRPIDRHVVKRRLSAVLKTLIDEEKVPHLQLVVVSNRSILDQNFVALKNALEKSLSKIV
jgi:ribonuclease P protein component